MRTFCKLQKANVYFDCEETTKINASDKFDRANNNTYTI